jgi:hypothetical protein
VHRSRKAAQRVGAAAVTAAVAATAADEAVDMGRILTTSTAAETSMADTLKHLFVALCVTVFVAAAPGPAQAQQQTRFPSAEAAANPFVDAIARNDDQAVRAILGADYRKVLPLDEVSQEDKLDFLSAWAEGHRVTLQGEKQAVLEVGKTHWALPIPMVKRADGWVFDTRAGADEMITRRIGRNELAAMEAVLAYFDAQKDYARKEREAGMGLVYAQKFFSTPGKKDGLYWPTAPGEEPSPLGPAYSAARTADGAYHGYYFRILTGQGKNANGGAYDYRINGRMSGGFALIAWPAQYGKSGIMSFMVSHDGVVFQKNLGPGGDAVARRMQRFDHDTSWQAVVPPSAMAAGATK